MEAETPHNVTVLENIVEPLADAGQDGGVFIFVYEYV